MAVHAASRRDFRWKYIHEAGAFPWNSVHVVLWDGRRDLLLPSRIRYELFVRLADRQLLRLFLVIGEAHLAEALAGHNVPHFWQSQWEVVTKSLAATLMEERSWRALVDFLHLNGNRSWLSGLTEERVPSSFSGARQVVAKTVPWLLQLERVLRLRQRT